jgi:putative SOS response-associated peptidase YedK
MRWGLVPHWAKDTKSIHINARVETVASNNLFRESFLRRRCLIPADGFYEWEPPEEGRRPHWVYRADGFPMVFAGIWATRKDPDTEDWVRTCSIVTTAAAGPILPIHDRMPVSLGPGSWDLWLDREVDNADQLLALLANPGADLLMEHRVSREVNSVKNNGPQLRDPVEAETLF